MRLSYLLVAFLSRSAGRGTRVSGVDHPACRPSLALATSRRRIASPTKPIAAAQYPLPESSLCERGRPEHQRGTSASGNKTRRVRMARKLRAGENDAVVIGENKAFRHLYPVNLASVSRELGFV